MLNAFFLAVSLSAMPAAEPTPPSCETVLTQLREAHAKDGHGEMEPQRIPNGVMFFWADQEGTTYATVFLKLPEGAELTQGFFKKKGTCMADGQTEVEYFSASQKQ